VFLLFLRGHLPFGTHAVSGTAVRHCIKPAGILRQSMKLQWVEHLIVWRECMWTYTNISLIPTGITQNYSTVCCWPAGKCYLSEKSLGPWGQQHCGFQCAAPLMCWAAAECCQWLVCDLRWEMGWKLLLNNAGVRDEKTDRAQKWCTLTA